jgi:hypothetical protein
VICPSMRTLDVSFYNVLIWFLACVAITLRGEGIMRRNALLAALLVSLLCAPITMIFIHWGVVAVADAFYWVCDNWIISCEGDYLISDS